MPPKPKGTCAAPTVRAGRFHNHTCEGTGNPPDWKDPQARNPDLTLGSALGMGSMDYDVVAGPLREVAFNSAAVIELAHPSSLQPIRPPR